MDTSNVLKNVVELSMSAVEVSVSSVNILSSAREVQGAATSMASAVEEMAASIAEIEASAQKSNQAVDDSSRLTHEGLQELLSLNEIVGQTDDAFESLAQQTVGLQNGVADLDAVIELISSIANQTNLLALNATIEAARAGEHGKGFAVVANEVKTLSRQTREATDRIKDQISQLNAAFKAVLDTVGNSKTLVSNVMERTQKVERDFEVINRNGGDIAMQVSELANIISQQKEAVDLIARNMVVVKDKGDQNLQAVESLADQTDKSVVLIEGWRANLASEEIENKVIYLAKADHLLWKKRLLDMAAGRSSLKSSELASHMSCRLGNWYYDAQNAGLKGNPAFDAIEEPHKKVHHFGIEAAKCFENHRLEEGLQYYAQLETASAQVLDCLNTLLLALEVKKA